MTPEPVFGGDLARAIGSTVSAAAAGIGMIRTALAAGDHEYASQVSARLELDVGALSRRLETELRRAERSR